MGKVFLWVIPILVLIVFVSSLLIQKKNGEIFQQLKSLLRELLSDMQNSCALTGKMFSNEFIIDEYLPRRNTKFILFNAFIAKFPSASVALKKSRMPVLLFFISITQVPQQIKLLEHPDYIKNMTNSFDEELAQWSNSSPQKVSDEEMAILNTLAQMLFEGFLRAN